MALNRKRREHLITDMFNQAASVQGGVSLAKLVGTLRIETAIIEFGF